MSPEVAVRVRSFQSPRRAASAMMLLKVVDKHHSAANGASRGTMIRIFVPAPGLVYRLIRPQAIGHDVMDDVQSEARAALVAPGREKWIEHLAPDLRAHAAAVI
jgi:hypothetical protein